MSREKGRVAMMSRMEIMVMRCAQMPGPSSHTEKVIAVSSRIHFWKVLNNFFCQTLGTKFTHNNLPWLAKDGGFCPLAPFEVSPLFGFLAPRDAGLENVMLTFTFPAYIDFCYENFSWIDLSSQSTIRFFFIPVLYYNCYAPKCVIYPFSWWLQEK